MSLDVRRKRKSSVGFPDLSVSNPARLAPTSDKILSEPTPKRVYGQLPEGFAIGNNHKQGFSLFRKEDLKYAGSKKT